MARVDGAFKERVYGVVAAIPKGKVASYGDVAAAAGASWAAWEVGQIAHNGPTNLPWQRVVNKSGGLARSYPGGGFAAHSRALQADGVEVGADHRVAMERYRWQPNM